jgi:hypothetical protein
VNCFVFSLDIQVLYSETALVLYWLVSGNVLVLYWLVPGNDLVLDCLASVIVQVQIFEKFLNNFPF